MSPLYDDLWTYPHVRQPPVELVPALQYLPRHTVFFDCETKRSAKEVGGWKNIPQMGVSCAASWSPAWGTRLYPYQKLLPLVRDLLEAPVVIGHNIERFDLPLLRPVIDLALEWASEQKDPNLMGRILRKHYTQSLLHPGRHPVQGLRIDTLALMEQATGRKWALEVLAEYNLGASKSAHGLDAIQWYKAKRWTKLYAYCIQDVALTRDLFLYGLTYESVTTPDGAVPVNWGYLLEATT